MPVGGRVARLRAYDRVNQIVGTKGVMCGINGPEFKACYEDAPCDGKAES